MGERIGVGVVGASGWMAGALAAGAEYADGDFKKGVKHSQSYVAALCDLNESAMAKRKQELSLDRAASFTDYEQLLAAPGIDAVIIAVPNRLHARFAKMALQAGKHVFLEKPLAINWEESESLLRAAVESPCTTKLDYILVHYDEQQKLRELIARGAFGAIASTYFTYRHPIQVAATEDQRWKLSGAVSGGALPMGICHAVSLTVYQVDADPVEVVCKASPALCRPFDYAPRQDLLITFANGVVGVVQGNIDFAEKYDARHTVMGTEGQFDYTPYNPQESRVMWSSKSLQRAYGPDPDFAKDHLDSGDVWAHKCAATVDAFVDAVQAGRKDPLLGLESPLVRRTEALIWAAEESAACNGKPVAVRLR
jgi:UDP-N-acetyl-2-amino-2-deoxyglucuronate dehydrogenase